MSVTEQTYPEGTEPGWEVIESHVPPKPMPNYGPRVWKGADIIKALHRASETIRLGPEALRRNFALVNPPLEASSHTVYFSMQLVNPGETAETHRHTAAACRFMIQGRAATIVNGIRFDMKPGNLVLTPAWSWHGHVNESSEPAVWLDILDWPMPKMFHATFAEEYEGTPPVSLSGQVLESAREVGLYPTHLVALGDADGSAPMAWRWEKVQPLLQRAAAVGDGNPYDGVAFTYVHPNLRDAVSKRMGVSLSLLKKGVRTKAHRHTSVGLYHVVAGEGVSVIGGREYAWETHDSFVVPPWHWHEHQNTSRGDTTLLMVTDEPALEKLGLYRTEHRD